MDDKVWGVMQQQVCVSSVAELKQHLTDVWHCLQQNIIEAASNERTMPLRACMHMDNILDTYCNFL